MQGFSSFRGKRSLDIVLGLTGLVLVLPMLAVAALLLRITSRGPVIFVQDRSGQGGCTFQLYKLRTMTVNKARTTGQTADHDPQVLWVGRILRRFKIDELPQLWNVVTGDMSLVGPRPLVPDMLDVTPDWAMVRHIPRPGLTGLVQVRGGRTLSWNDRWKLDVQYRPRFWGDLGIMIKTLAVVILGEARFHAPLPDMKDPALYSTVTDFARLRG